MASLAPGYINSGHLSLRVFPLSYASPSIFLQILRFCFSLGINNICMCEYTHTYKYNIYNFHCCYCTKISICIAALLTIARNWDQPSHPSTDEWILKACLFSFKSRWFSLASSNTWKTQITHLVEGLYVQSQSGRCLSAGESHPSRRQLVWQFCWLSQLQGGAVASLW